MTRCADRRDRGYLAWVAVANEVAHLRLEAAPIDASPHALEIHVAGFEEPLVVIAEPVGEPTDQGFPLRLKPLDDHQAEVLRAELFGGDAAAPESPRPVPQRVSHPPRMSGSEPPPMSMRHREAVARVPLDVSLARRAPGSLVGRALGDGRFALDRLIGGGASGEVYGGVHTTLRRPIAVKVLHPTLQQSPDYCARFYSEALAASQLDHRNVLRILDYGQEPDGLLYIVMELLEGSSLQEILDREGTLSTERIVHLVAQACAGLAHAHDAGVVHRDIKPENIVVVKRIDDEGNETELVKVCDFGIAHWSQESPTEIGDEDATIINKPDSSKVVGTPAYMAPEQIRNETVDARADVYALGIVLYELATGKLPFPSENPIEILMRHLNEKPQPPSRTLRDFDRELERVMMKALEKSPAKRQPNARVLRAELRELVDEDAHPSGQYRRVSLRSMRNELTSTDFVERTSETLSALATADDRTRVVGLTALAEALRAAIGAANVKASRDMVAWLQQRAADPQLRAEERDQIDRVLRVLRDPQALGMLASHIMDGKIARLEEAAPLLVAGGPVAARALLDARRNAHLTLEVRARFVGSVRAIGAGTLPVLVAALEPLAALASRAEEVLAEDLLRAMPDVRSDAAGEVTVRFVRVDKPSIGAVAVQATTLLWDRRAHSLLLGVLDAPVDSMRLAAIAALKRLGAIDDWALERLARIVNGQLPASDELRVEAAAGFALAVPESRPRAAAFLQQKLAPRQGIGSLFGGAKESGTMTVALARALVTLDPALARGVIERLAASRTEVRHELEALLASLPG
jgi:serine/threonine-protein kinase